jgi:hypothetical protein
MIVSHFYKFVHTIIVISPTYFSDEIWKAVRLRTPQRKVWYPYFNEDVIEHIYNFLVEEKKEGRHTLLVVDDMTREIRSADRAEMIYDRIICNNRWLYCTLIHSAQMIVHVPPEMRKNWDQAILWYPRNMEELNQVYKICGKMNRQKFDKLLKKCTQTPYHFLYIKKQNTRTYYFHCFTPLTVVDKDSGEVIQ